MWNAWRSDGFGGVSCLGRDPSCELPSNSPLRGIEICRDVPPRSRQDSGTAVRAVRLPRLLYLSSTLSTNNQLADCRFSSLSNIPNKGLVMKTFTV